VSVHRFVLLAGLGVGVLAILLAVPAVAATSAVPPPPPMPPAEPTAVPAAPMPAPANTSAAEPGAEKPAPNASAEEPANDGKKPSTGHAGEEKSPALQISAEAGTLDGKKNTFLYEGNVKAILDDTTLSCDRLEGSYDPQTKQFLKLVAVGHVVMDGPRWRATCARAEYDPETEVAQKERRTIIEGDELTYDVKQDRRSGKGVTIIVPTEDFEWPK